MPKEKSNKKTATLRHAPLGADIDTPAGKLRAPGSRARKSAAEAGEEELDIDLAEDEALPATLGSRIYQQAREQRREISEESLRAGSGAGKVPKAKQSSRRNEDDEDDEDERLMDTEWADEEEGEEGEELIEFEGENVVPGMSESEEAVVQRFLNAGHSETRTLADIIMEKIREKGESGAGADVEDAAAASVAKALPPKVVEVFTSVGGLLKHYKSGKLPKALKMLPHLKNWEDVMWLTRPDEWSPCATFACTRIFASNLNGKMAQRFFNLVLLEKCRDDIRTNKTLNYHLYMALKKALFKPAAFYKGILLPLCLSQTCTLREATIIGSVLTKVSIPGNHSAAALLRLAEMSYSGSNSLFIRVLLNKRYALPRRVIDALVDHFTAFVEETRDLPVIWHQALLAFAQRYKLEVNDEQKEAFKALLKVHQHHQITPEIRREMFNVSA